MGVSDRQIEVAVAVEVAVRRRVAHADVRQAPGRTHILEADVTRVAKR